MQQPVDAVFRSVVFIQLLGDRAGRGDLELDVSPGEEAKALLGGKVIGVGGREADDTLIEGEWHDVVFSSSCLGEHRGRARIDGGEVRNRQPEPGGQQPDDFAVGCEPGIDHARPEPPLVARLEGRNPRFRHQPTLDQVGRKPGVGECRGRG